MVSSKLPRVVSRINFPVVVGLRFPLSCWLSTKEHSHLLQATLRSLLYVPHPRLSQQWKTSLRDILPAKAVSLLLNLVYYFLSLFEEPVSTKEEKLTIMECSLIYFKEKGRFASKRSEESLPLLALQSYPCMYIIQQDFIFLHIPLGPLQGSASDEPDYSFCERQQENISIVKSVPLSFGTCPCFTSIIGHIL